MADDFWVLVPKQSEQNVSGTVADAFIVSTPQGSALDNKLLGNFAGQVSSGGKSGYLRAGPYPSMAAAQAYLGRGASSTPGPVPGTSISPGGGVSLASPFSSIQNALTAFYDVVTNGKMWRSLGWVALGVVLMLLGLAMWIGPKVAPLAAL